MAEQTRLDMRQLEGLLQERIVIKINLSDREVVRRAPIAVDAPQQFWVQRFCFHQSRAKSMKPRSTSVWMSLTRTRSPTSRPWKPRSKRPSIGGLKSRTHVPLS